MIRVAHRMWRSYLPAEITRCPFNKFSIYLPHFLFSPSSTISYPPSGGFCQLKQSGPVLRLQMGGIRFDQILGLPANCSDMSDMLVCLVTPHSSTVTKVALTLLLSTGPSGSQRCEAWRSPSLKAKSVPPDLLSKRPPPFPLPPPETRCPFNPSSIPSLTTQAL